MQITPCDRNAVNASTNFPPPPPPTPDCVDGDGDGYGSGSQCLGSDCDDTNPNLTTSCGGHGSCSSEQAGYCTAWGVACYNGDCFTPVLVDAAGDGFDLTDGAGGVDIDLDGDGTMERLAWTAAGSDDAWLALDRDGNGVVDGGRELFGNFTPQAAPPPGESKNGFRALAEYDEPSKGGNGDGRIDAADAVFGRLLLWRDSNHDGASAASELHTLPQLGVSRVDLDYREASRRDGHGNLFRYRAKVYGAGGAHLGRWAYDVFLLRRQ